MQLLKNPITIMTIKLDILSVKALILVIFSAAEILALEEFYISEISLPHNIFTRYKFCSLKILEYIKNFLS